MSGVASLRAAAGAGSSLEVGRHSPFPSTDTLRNAQVLNRRSIEGSGLLWGVAASFGMCNN